MPAALWLHTDPASQSKLITAPTHTSWRHHQPPCSHACAALPHPAVVLPERWLKIWSLLNSDDDDAVRDVARQARPTPRHPTPKPKPSDPQVRYAALFLHRALLHVTPPPHRRQA